VSSCLTFHLRQAWLNLRGQVDAVLAEHELTIGGYAALLTLAERPGISAADLGHAFTMTRQSAAELLSGLEAAGLVTRDRPNPADRRLRMTELTDAGWTRLRAAAVVVQAKEAELLARTTPEQVTAAAAWLNIIADAGGGEPSAANRGRTGPSNGGYRSKPPLGF
jgi:DNA-binding MarR family transcriptional regulator